MKDTFSRAAAYLSGAQHTDGSWGDGDPFVCARATYALKVAGGPEQVQDNGVSYLEKLQDKDGHFPAKSDMYTDAACTAYALIVLNQFNYSKASLPVSRGIMWLLENQSPDGSWSGRNVKKNAYTTSLCLRALHTFYLSGLAKYRRGVEHVLEKLEEPGFFNEPVSHVYAPVLNLRRIDALPDEASDAFLRYTEAHMTEAMEKGQIADVAYLAGALGAVNDAGLRMQCLSWLQSTQNTDGGFGKTTGTKSDPNWAALVVLALGNKL